MRAGPFILTGALTYLIVVGANVGHAEPTAGRIPGEMSVRALRIAAASYPQFEKWLKNRRVNGSAWSRYSADPNNYAVLIVERADGVMVSAGVLGRDDLTGYRDGFFCFAPDGELANMTCGTAK